MKKIFLTLGIVLGLFLVSSCDDDLLEQYTPGTLEEPEGILSNADLQGLMNRTYSLLTPVGEIEFNSVFTDEVAIGFANGGQGLAQDYVFNLNSDADAPNDIWATYYVLIAYTNRLIKESDKLQTTTYADPGFANERDVANKIKAQALILRAYSHNQLVSYFSTDPTVPSALGVLVATTVTTYPFSDNLMRKTNAEVYTQIDADIAAALAIYASAGPINDRLAANADFARATQARSYALRGDYTNALIAATAVINTSGLILANSAANYRAVFHTDAQPATQEVIFKIKKTAGQTRTGGIWASVSATAAGSPFFEMSHSLFNLFNPIYGTENATTGVTQLILTPGGGGTTATNVNSWPDARLSAITAQSSEFKNGKYLTDPTYNKDTEKMVIRKYPGTTTASNRLLVNDIKISRLSEMYFIRAEAYAEANNLTAAAAEVQHKLS